MVSRGAEHHGLAVVLGRVAEVPEPHPGEVHVVGLQRLQVHVPHGVLWRSTGHAGVNGDSANHAKNTNQAHNTRLERGLNMMCGVDGKPGMCL